MFTLPTNVKNVVFRYSSSFTLSRYLLSSIDNITELGLAISRTRHNDQLLSTHCKHFSHSDNLQRCMLKYFCGDT